MKIYTNDLVKGHSDFKVKRLTFGLYTQVSDSEPLGPLVSFGISNEMKRIYLALHVLCFVFMDSKTNIFGVTLFCCCEP